MCAPTWGPVWRSSWRDWTSPSAGRPRIAATAGGCPASICSSSSTFCCSASPRRRRSSRTGPSDRCTPPCWPVGPVHGPAVIVAVVVTGALADLAFQIARYADLLKGRCPGPLGGEYRGGLSSPLEEEHEAVEEVFTRLGDFKAGGHSYS